LHTWHFGKRALVIGVYRFIEWPKMQGSLPLVINAWSATDAGVKTINKFDFPKTERPNG
jgi:hypothetical protein